MTMESTPPDRETATAVVCCPWAARRKACRKSSMLRATACEGRSLSSATNDRCSAARGKEAGGAATTGVKDEC